MSRAFDRREFLKLSGTAAAAGWLGGAKLLQSAGEAKGRPNVLFIVADDLRPELGCYGNETVRTPHIDGLAGRGAVFTRAYCQQALCNPSRASLMTGLRPDTLRVWNLDTHFRRILPMARTLPQSFMQNGYQAAYVGKIFHGRLQDAKSWSRPEPVLEGGETYQNPDTRLRIERLKYTAKWLGKSEGWQANILRGPADERFEGPGASCWDTLATDAAIGLMEELKAAGPFFLGVGYAKPHLPYCAPAKFWDLYDPGQIPLPAVRDIPRGSPAFSMNDNSELSCYEEFIDVLHPAQGGLTDSQIRRLKHGYYACVSYIDDQVGRLLKAMETLGLADDTIVVLVGDHGFKLGEYGAWGKRGSYEVDVRSPLIVAAPGHKGGVRSGALVEYVDIYPTLCDLAGIAAPSGLEGTSFVPLLGEPDRLWKPAAFSQSLMGYTQRFMGHTIRTDRYRYVRWNDIITNRVLARELYDHETDPGETVNLAAFPENDALRRELGMMLRRGWRAARPSERS